MKLLLWRLIAPASTAASVLLLSLLVDFGPREPPRQTIYFDKCHEQAIGSVIPDERASAKFTATTMHIPWIVAWVSGQLNVNAPGNNVQLEYRCMFHTRPFKLLRVTVERQQDRLSKPGFGIYQLGTKVNLLDRDAGAVSILSQGWKVVFGQTAWALSDAAFLMFTLDPRLATKFMKLSLDVVGFVSQKVPTSTVVVFAGGFQIGVIDFSQESPTVRTEFLVPFDALRGSDTLQIGFASLNLVSQRDLGLGDGDEKLGFGLNAFTLSASHELPASVAIFNQVPDNSGSPIGNLTGFGGLAASFDGRPLKSAASCSAVAGGNVRSPAGYVNFIGKDWGSGNTKTITGFKVYSPIDQGMLQSARGRVKLEGSNDNENWIELALAAGGEANGSLVSGTITPQNLVPYRYHRVNIQGNGVNELLICQVKFFIKSDEATH